jgi:hypothetical protein
MADSWSWQEPERIERREIEEGEHGKAWGRRHELAEGKKYLVLPRKELVEKERIEEWEIAQGEEDRRWKQELAEGKKELVVQSSRSFPVTPYFPVVGRECKGREVTEAEW